jgi:nucleoside-diphosphate-sugar epimerase
LRNSLVHRAAARLLRKRLGPEDRVLVLGAGGWFGSTLLALLAESATEARVLGLTRLPRRVTVGRHSWDLGGWDWDTVTGFAPSLLLNCAFLTRERVEQTGLKDYVADNVVLTSRFLRTIGLPSVRGALTVSSGAAVDSSGIPDVELNPYGHLKRAEEILSRDVAAAHDVPLVVSRAWSVSGPLVQRPRDYAFSDLILQVAAGPIQVRAAHEVWRRYVGADDLLAVCLSLAIDGWTGVVDSGGELVEIGDLAKRVAELRPGTQIERPALDGSPPDRYHSDGQSWSDACRRVKHTEASVEEQIRAVSAVLSGSR